MPRVVAAQAAASGTPGASAAAASRPGSVEFAEELRGLMRQDGGHPALERLLELESKWAMDPEFNRLLAEVALSDGRFAEATLALERLVLLEPLNAGAWLDLALASERVGDRDTARRALDTLKARFREVPATARLAMGALEQRLAQAASPAQIWRFRVGLSVGRDSNVNGGLASGTLTLTPGGERVQVPIDPAYRPRASAFGWLGAEAQGRISLGRQDFDIRGVLTERRVGVDAAYDTRDYAFAVGGRVPGVDRLQWLSELRRLDYGGEPLLGITRVRGVWEPERRLGSCQPALAAEWESRAHRGALDVYDGKILWFDAALRCGLGPGTLGAWVRAGSDRDSGMRPGGTTSRVEWALVWAGPLSAGVDLVAGINAAKARDTAPYSPLLFSDLVRGTDRVTVRAELTWRLTPSWQAVASAEHSRQDANLGLFAFRQTVVASGLRYLH